MFVNSQFKVQNNEFGCYQLVVRKTYFNNTVVEFHTIILMVCSLSERRMTKKKTESSIMRHLRSRTTSPLR